MSYIWYRLRIGIFLYSLLIIVSLSNLGYAEDAVVTIYPSFVKKSLDLYFPLLIDAQSHPDALPVDDWSLKIEKPKIQFQNDGMWADSQAVLTIYGRQQVVPIHGKFYAELSPNQQMLLLKMRETTVPLNLEVNGVELNVGAFRIDTLIDPIEIPLRYAIDVPQKGRKYIQISPQFQWSLKDLKIKFNVAILVTKTQPKKG